MKITCSKRDDIIRDREEYDKKYAKLESIHKEGEHAYRMARRKREQDIANSIKAAIGPTPLMPYLEVYLDSSFQKWKDQRGYDVRISCHDGNKFDDDVALAWNYSVRMTEEGIKSESGSWSGLSATTPAQLADLKESVRVIEKLQSIDWQSILDIEWLNSDDFYNKENEEEFNKHKAARRDWNNELKQAEIEEGIGKNVAFAVSGALQSDWNVRFRGWACILSQTDKFFNCKVVSSAYGSKSNLSEYMSVAPQYRVKKDVFFQCLDMPIVKQGF